MLGVQFCSEILFARTRFSLQNFDKIDMPTGVSSQQFLAVDTIRENIIVMKGGGLRVVLMCSSLNFALKSADEQDAIVYQFQNMLNSLDFPVQFVVHSRRLNIEPYLDELGERQKAEENELLKLQIAEYLEFVRSFVEMTNIMSKTFYVVVSYTPAIITTGFLGGVLSALGMKKEKEEGDADTFEEYKSQLWQRVDTVVTGLSRLGIRSAPLNTEELIELFYGLYNPTEFEQVAKT